MNPTNEPRAMLIAVQEGTNRTAWEFDGQVAICSGAPCWGALGAFPGNSRWESSLAHWTRWFRKVMQPAGWRYTTAAERGMAARKVAEIVGRAS